MSYLSILIIFMVLGSHKSLSCPAFLSMSRIQDVYPNLRQTKRSNWRVYVARDDKSSPKDRKISSSKAFAQLSRSQAMEIPIQWDQLDEDGIVTPVDQKYSWLRDYVSLDNRIVLDADVFVDASLAETFASKNTQSRKCLQPTNVFRLYESAGVENNLNIYLVHCDGTDTEDSRIAHASLSQGPKIYLDEKSHTVRSPWYEYSYLPKNHLMFDKIYIIDQNATRFVVSEKSEQIIHIDVKNFFNLNFDADDVETKIKKTHHEPYSMIAQLTTFLKILFFKIDLELNLNVAFYNKAVHVPMILTMPADGPKNVNPGSGILFTWKMDPGKVVINYLHSMPVLKPDIVKAGHKALGEYGVASCPELVPGGKCRFFFDIQMGDFKFLLNFELDREMVQRGFFPMYVASEEQAIKAMKWSKSGKSSSSDRIGFYMETGSLSKGEHLWDLWLQLKPLEKSLDATNRNRIEQRSKELCPKEILLKTLD